MAAKVRHQEEIKQADELLFAGRSMIGFARGLFHGRFLSEYVFPYPTLADAERGEVEAAVAAVRAFAESSIDPAAIDRNEEIPVSVIEGLAELGVLGMTAPPSFGGRGFSQLAYGRVMEVLGGHCGATAIFVNAHHSIGLRALLLFGTEAQKARWLPPLARGEQLAAFALTEPEAGSDAANVQTQATPSEDGQSFIVNGEKRYITNGAIAQVLTVMARTPVPGRKDTQVTALLVSPDMPGFEVVEPRMRKLGIRGTATARLRLRDMRVPRTHVLGQLGKGLKIALTVLDYGRTTFGACCTGAAKTLLRLSIRHARERRQFGRRLSDFELVKKKIAHMAAWTYAIEAMTQVTARLIDRGTNDYMLETAMLKVYATEAVWLMVNDAFQIHGGAAYFTDRPLERMLRDARLNQIGEGANDVLLSFIALVGMRGPGLELNDAWQALQRPWRNWSRLLQAGQAELRTLFVAPPISVRAQALQHDGKRLGRCVLKLSRAIHYVLQRHREAVIDRQYLQERIAWAAVEIFASACVLSRIDIALASSPNTLGREQELTTAQYFLMASDRQIQRHLQAVYRRGAEDALCTSVADLALHNQ
ncbi:MAG: acyl-CoA dehydrogenase family protein [Gammaproteobacteria bacterium]